MTTYRMVTRHVRYWRGSIHKWSMSWLYTGTKTWSPTDCQNMITQVDSLLYSKTAADGGTFEAQVYNRDAGGPALASYTAFDWEVPADWIASTGYVWGGPGDAIQEPAAEVAALLEWPGGLSSSGKPVKFRKWVHAVPQSAAAGGAADIAPSTVTAINTQMGVIQGMFGGSGVALGAAGRFAGTGAVLTHYGNHQMPRGRRRKPLVTSSGHYTGPTIELPPLAD